MSDENMLDVRYNETTDVLEDIILCKKCFISGSTEYCAIPEKNS